MVSVIFPCRFNTQPPEGGWFHDVFPFKSVWRFQHTAARRRLGIGKIGLKQGARFQHTAARRRLELVKVDFTVNDGFQHTAARRRLGLSRRLGSLYDQVSTHSRPKAAGSARSAARAVMLSFNTQPPEGGWTLSNMVGKHKSCFNTQPPEGGWSLSQKPCSIRFRSPDFARLPRKARTRV